MQNIELEVTSSFDSEEDERLPILVLATRVHIVSDRFTDGKHFMTLREWDAYKFKPGREWHLTSHQTAGYACHHHYLWFTQLTPKPSMAALMKQLDEDYQDSCVGQWGVTVDEILNYRERLKAHGLDCNRSYGNFEEGIYPIDYSADALNAIANDELPDDLDELIQWSGPLHKLCGSVGRWKIYVLGHNCD